MSWKWLHSLPCRALNISFGLTIYENWLYWSVSFEPLLKSFHFSFNFSIWRPVFVLVGKALQFQEPVLLVGDTGCGKTTICQLLAALKNQKLFMVNCHQHSESSDFLGGLRPVRQHSENVILKIFKYPFRDVCYINYNGCPKTTVSRARIWDYS